MQRKLLVKNGYSFLPNFFNIAANDFDAKKSAGSEQIRCKWGPMYMQKVYLGIIDLDWHKVS